MDIRTLAVKDTFDVLLKDADGAPIMGDDGKQACITIHGPGTKVYNKAQSKRNRKLVEAMRSGHKADTSLDDQAEFLADITASFNGFSYGEALEGRAMHKACYADTSIGFVAEQVGRAAGDWANFSNGSATS